MAWTEEELDKVLKEHEVKLRRTLERSGVKIEKWVVTRTPGGQRIEINDPSDSCWLEAAKLFARRYILDPLERGEVVDL